MKLSVIVITRNEEADIRDCLASVTDIASEIVVVDSGSTDRTLDICREFNARIFHKDWTGYSAQKQEALDRSTGPWVLNLDADERVSKELAGEIRRILTDSSGQPAFNGYEIPYHHFFLGRRLRFGGHQGETHVRLFKKDGASYGQEAVHEGIRVARPIGRLTGPILHTSYRDLSDYLAKCNEYTSMIAARKFREGQRFNSFHHVRLPFEFVARYIFKLGFLDGGPGLIYAVLSSYYVWLKFVKLIDRENA